MSPRSFRRLKRMAGLARRLLFDNVARFAVQEEEYAHRLRQLGVPVEKLAVTGSVKYDGAAGERDSSRTQSLRRLLGSPWRSAETGDRGQETGDRRSPLLSLVSCPLSPFVWVAGSTHAPEESIVLGAFARLRTRFPHLRLILVPRHPDRFEEVARLVEQAGLPFV